LPDSKILAADQNLLIQRRSTSSKAIADALPDKKFVGQWVPGATMRGRVVQSGRTLLRNPRITAALDPAHGQEESLRRWIHDA
jgi:putative intracellular protease/amidase